MQNKEYEFLTNEIEKLKFHNSTLLNLINSGDSQKNKINIYEMILTFDLTKHEFNNLSLLINNFENKESFEENAKKINSNFHHKNLIHILKTFINSNVNKEKCENIIKSIS